MAKTETSGDDSAEMWPIRFNWEEPVFKNGEENECASDWH